ncbi:putative ankyrin repeat-containing protein-like isoform 2 [Capsicum annuum]|nr:putative ankyrin repeat-containing protein-like isoform 2 [Capsicum annuum]KAF3659498.1 putative ankyrin repeat-containing protein-like isoform 2 [Capsicum annuum]
MSNPNAETGTGVKMQLREDDQDKAKKKDQAEIESIMKIAQIHIVVVTLIMTVTFAASITLPGGFESNTNSSNQGMAILTRKTVFRAFVVSDAIAFTCSAVAIFICFLMENETPLYLAAEYGFHDALINILEYCKKATYSAGPSNRTPLHAVVIHEHEDCIRSLWRWNKPLCEEPDLWGWNSLHYAVKLGVEAVVSDMLAWKTSLVYLLAGNENDWTKAIHIAASEGDVSMINKLLNHRPDCRDMLNRNNQNALHVSVLNTQDKVVCSLLDSDKCDSLVDEPDRDGNTPLYLLAVSGNHVPELINHTRAKKM